MKLMRLVVLGLFTLLLSTGLQAQQAEKKKDKIMEQLDLNEVQEASMKAINQKYKPQMKAVKENTASSKDEKKAKLKELRAQKMTEVEGVLTPEQMTKYKEIKAANKGKKGKKGKKSKK